MSEFVLLLVILIEGFVTISAEILTIRQLLPVVGNSVIVTSLIIGVFLLFLAYGYRRGGQYQQGYVAILKKNFIKSALWLGVGLSHAFIDLFFYLCQRYISGEPLIALSLYLLLTTAPLVYILGQTVPITMNLSKGIKVGEVGGRILHLSTLGSFLGSVLTSLLLMNYVGVAWTVVFNFSLLMLLFFILFSKKKADFRGALILGLALYFVYSLNISMEKNLFVKTNAYADYQILKDGENNKILMINKSLSSLLAPDKKGFNYIEFIKRILFEDLKLRDKDILVLGAGGFTLSASGSHGNHFIYVDIDHDIEAIVKKHFLNSIKGEFIASDARAFLTSTQKKFDVIVSDAYSHQRSIPAHLLTQEYLIEIKQALNPSGIALLNMIARPTLEDAFSKQVDNTIRSVFNSCMVVPEKYTYEASNIMYICRNDAQGLSHRWQIYTDNLNRITLDFLKSTVHHP